MYACDAGVFLRDVMDELQEMLQEDLVREQRRRSLAKARDEYLAELELCPGQERSVVIDGKPLRFVRKDRRKLVFDPFKARAALCRVSGPRFADLATKALFDSCVAVEPWVVMRDDRGRLRQTLLTYETLVRRVKPAP